MAISDICKFEFKSNVDKLEREKGITRKEAIAQIAYELEIAETTAKSKYYRAQKELKPELQNATQKSETHANRASTFHSGKGGKRKNAGRPQKITFNETNENIKWAKWTWNPVTGCKHGCDYCYARDIANRFYKQKFEPTFHPSRLVAPQNTVIPKYRKTEDGITNVFVCSMADLFGDWVPKEWIEKTLLSVKNSPQWNFLFLTKNPKRYIEFKFSDNCWLGATADNQIRADIALSVFENIDDSFVKFISCEPLKEKIEINYENIPISWAIIGGQSKTSKCPEFQPEWDWVFSLTRQFDDYNLKYYWKPNLEVRPEMYPR